MESMRTLNTSLPRSPRRRRASRSVGPGNDALLQTFKSAALSVTNLYKSAAAAQSTARQEGYQDAIADLISFLDQENLGLDDGEGWSVRQWATERHENIGHTSHTGPDSDDDVRTEVGKVKRSPSPSQNLSTEVRSASPRDLSPPQPAAACAAPLSDLFTFRASHPYPHEGPEPLASSSPSSQGSNIRLEVLPRSVRANRTTRHSRPGTTRQLGSGAGAKRRIPFGDFFDLEDSLGSHKRRLL